MPMHSQPSSTDDTPHWETMQGPCPADLTIQWRAIPHTFSVRLLDPDAIKIIRRLLYHGFEAFLVGGCVRDLLLGKIPKDFDVVTNATPAQIKKLFRNCRLIGRRFRLAHLHYRNGKIIEVSTYRREPWPDEDLSDSPHAAWNLFGSAADDAVRRDFTMNALMYDVVHHRILDWLGGYDDIQARRIRSIGAPDRRIPEDPVRIIRAVKFAAKLDLTIDDALQEALRTYAGKLATCSPSRLLEELGKIFKSGASAACFAQLHAYGALTPILPGLAASFAARPEAHWSLLAQLDAAFEANRPLCDSIPYAALLYPAFADIVRAETDVYKALSGVLRAAVAPIPVTRRHMAEVKSLFALCGRILHGPGRRRSRKVMQQPLFPSALWLLEAAGQEDAVAPWRQVERSATSAQRAGTRKKRRRRRAAKRAASEDATALPDSPGQ